VKTSRWAQPGSNHRPRTTGCCPPPWCERGGRTAGDAERVWEAVGNALTAAAAETDPERRRRLATVVAGGGATGVELAGELAEILPEAASGHGLAPGRPAVQLAEAGPAILAGSSPQLIDKAARIPSDLGVQVRANAVVDLGAPWRSKGMLPCPGHPSRARSMHRWSPGCGYRASD
jgi:Pyridine nucleotide-disulphide oxidoreductase